MSGLLEQLTRRQLLWHGDSQQVAYQAVSSGYPELDQQLGGGLPANGLIDLQSEPGIGELRLLLPYLQQQQQTRLLVFIAPPAELSADMLAGAGLNLSQLLLITPMASKKSAGRAGREVSKEALWAAEQCLSSGCCASVLLWPAAISLAQARRLQLAAEQGAASMILLRRPCQSLSLPVNLSVSLQPHQQGLQLTVLKRKGSWPGAPFLIDMHKRWPALCLVDSTGHQLRQAG